MIPFRTPSRVVPAPTPGRTLSIACVTPNPTVALPVAGSSKIWSASQSRIATLIPSAQEPGFLPVTITLGTTFSS